MGRHGTGHLWCVRFFYSASVSVMRPAFRALYCCRRLPARCPHEFSFGHRHIASLLGEAKIDGFVAEKLEAALQKLQAQVSVHWSSLKSNTVSHSTEAGKNQNLTLDKNMRTNTNTNLNTNMNMNTHMHIDTSMDTNLDMGHGHSGTTRESDQVF